MLRYVTHGCRLGFARRCASLHTLQIATAFCQKGSMTHFNKSPGEDAVISATWIAPGRLQGAALIGVTDGVGGWNRYGIDPAKLSHGLASELEREFLNKEDPDKLKLAQKQTNTDLDSSEKSCSDFGEPAPMVTEDDVGTGRGRNTGLAETIPITRDLLASSFANISANEENAGGTTVCVGVFDPGSAGLSVVNVGDSGVAVVRNGEVVLSSSRDVQGLVPEQLAVVPQWLKDLRASQLAAADQPVVKPRWMHSDIEHAKDIFFPLENDDIVLFATDGLWDNVYPPQIAKILGDPRGGQVDELAESLVRRAYYNSLDPYFASPYAVRGIMQGFEHVSGGKPDDIAIVVARVVRAGPLNL